MALTEEIQEDLNKYASNIDPMTIEVIKLSERVKIFNRFRELINEKEYQNDEIAASVLGWAYEKLADA
jgi:uncharacterized protein YoxC